MKEEQSVSQYNIIYRPRKWEDVYGQDATVKALRKRIVENDYPSAVLFQGPYGCGKTSICEIFAAAMQAHDADGNPDWSNPSCKSILNGSFDRDTIRLDGSQLSGKTDIIDFTRDLNLRPMFDKRRLLIIEEADQVSNAGMSSLLKVLEGLKPWVTVILLSMEEKGVSPAIKSRCQCYNIKPLGIKDIMYNLKHIMELSGDWTNDKIPTKFRTEGLASIAECSQGSMRNAVQYLEKCLVNETYEAEAINELLGVIDETATWKILDALLDKTKDENILRKIIWMKTGDETMAFYNYITMMLSEGLLYKATGTACDDNVVWRMKKMADNPNLEELFYCLTLHPQMNKPFLRASDLVGCIAAYYQGISFKPGQPITTETRVAEPVAERPLQRLRENVEEKVVIGCPNPKTDIVEEMMPPKNAAGIRMRQPKPVDISNIEIAF